MHGSESAEPGRQEHCAVALPKMTGHDEESQGLAKSSGQDAVLNPAPNLNLENDENIYVSVSLNSCEKLTSFNLLSEPSMNHHAATTTTNEAINMPTLATTHMFSVSPKLPLMSSKRNIAITEVTRSVTAPMMATQIMQSLSENHLDASVVMNVNYDKNDNAQFSASDPGAVSLNDNYSNNEGHKPNVDVYNGDSIEQDVLPESSDANEESAEGYALIPSSDVLSVRSVNRDFNVKTLEHLSDVDLNDADDCIVQPADNCSNLKQLADRAISIKPSVIDASADSTSVMRCSISNFGCVDSSPNQASAVIDSTTRTCQPMVDPSFDDDSNKVVPVNSVQSDNNERSNMCGLPISAPRICPAPLNFMISNSKEVSAEVSSMSELGNLIP